MREIIRLLILSLVIISEFILCFKVGNGSHFRDTNAGQLSGLIGMLMMIIYIADTLLIY